MPPMSLFACVQSLLEFPLLIRGHGGAGEDFVSQVI
jgi:hypothetical protein